MCVCVCVYLRAAKHPADRMTEAPYPVQVAQMSSRDRSTSKHAAELGHFPNDPMLTEAAEAEATMHNTDITFDL